MAELTVDVLKEILSHLPGGYVIEFKNNKTTYLILDKVEIDISGERLIEIDGVILSVFVQVTSPMLLSIIIC